MLLIQAGRAGLGWAHHGFTGETAERVEKKKERDERVIQGDLTQAAETSQILPGGSIKCGACPLGFPAMCHIKQKHFC